jgi:uncharacterized protein (DUF1697 family)
MQTWIALLRGVNVGGNNRLAMQPLRAALETLGFTAVQTYIQSGNCIFASTEINAARIAAMVGQAVLTLAGFLPGVVVLSQKSLTAALTGNPFAAHDPKTVHLFFLAAPPADTALAALHRLQTASEQFVLTGMVLYLHAPDGIGRSKLAAQAERCLGVAATARNLRSVLKIAEIAG